MAKENNWKIENGIDKPDKLPGINHGKGEDKGYPKQTKAKVFKSNKTK